MRTVANVAITLSFIAAVSGCSRPTGVAAAADAMGATTLNSIQFSGTGSHYAFGQAYAPGERWPRFEAKTYAVAVDYQAPAMRLEMLRAQAERPPRGGGAQPFAADQRSVTVVSAEHAWTEAEGRSTPNPAAAGDRRRQIWLTPHGVIKAAVASGATADGNVLNLTIGDRAVKATLNDQNLVERVEYLATNSVIGDVPVEITYSDYADFGGIQFPRHIVEKWDGFETVDIIVNDVKPNAPVSLPVPENVAKAPAPPPVPNVDVEKVAEGVWSLYVPNTRSLAVEFADHIVMLEGPTSEARSLAVNETIRRLVPGKPIRYVVNTHAHYDHAGGLRTYVAEGATVITHERNKAFYEKAWARPWTVESDLLAKSPKPAVIETVADKRVLTDRSGRIVELYAMENSGHNANQLLAYLPKERVILYGDGYNPPAGPDPRDPTRTREFAQQLYENVQRLKLNPARIAAVHSRAVVPFENLKINLGMSQPTATN